MTITRRRVVPKLPVIDPAGEPWRPRNCSTANLRESPQVVELMVTKALPHIRPTLERVAVELGISSRTLQRRLRSWGLSFEQIVKETRHSRALALISESQCAMIEVAFRLGYSDQAHFNRAFRRWTGTSPGAFRDKTP